MTKKNAYIQTERLCLQPFSEQDTDSAVVILFNDEIKKTYMLPDFACREEAVRLFERLRFLSLDESRFVYGVYLSNRLIGWINEVDQSDGSIELGYVVHPDWQNNGYATEALRASVQELFRMGYTAVRAGIFEENAASRHVLTKTGMQQIDLTEEIDYRGRTHRCIYFEIRRNSSCI